MATMQKITPNLWFDSNAEQAAQLYTSVFKNSSIGKIARYGKEGYEIHKMPEGMAMTVEFTLDGQRFTGLNGGPVFQFSEAVSFIINCESQDEVDYFWEKLSEGGDPKAQQCGWLKDKFGVSWQVVPIILGGLLADPDKARSEAVMHAMLRMKKLDIAGLQKAYDSAR